MFRVFIGLGSNVGDRLRYLSEAVHEIQQIVRVVRISSIYETEPVGMKSEQSFYNMVIETETSLLPKHLLSNLKGIETKFGRKADSHMMPREIDIDIELYDGYAFKDESVEVPHLELSKRKFLLESFNEIAPHTIHPLLKKTMQELCRSCTDSHNVVQTNYSLTA